MRFKENPFATFLNNRSNINFNVVLSSPHTQDAFKLRRYVCVSSSAIMLGTQPDPHRLVPPKDVSNGNHCQMGASDRGLDEVCLYQTTACTLYSGAHTPTPDTVTRGRNRGSIARSSEGYGTEEECVLSDPQGESDADADIEDTDCRLQEPGSLQRISSRRRKRPRPTRQDTTESEDDGGRSQWTPRWNPRLSPHRTHSRTILEVGEVRLGFDPRGLHLVPSVGVSELYYWKTRREESISQVRPLVIRRPSVEVQTASSPEASGGRKPALWPSSPRLPLRLLLLLLLPLVLLVVFLLFRPWASA